MSGLHFLQFSVRMCKRKGLDLPLTTFSKVKPAKTMEGQGTIPQNIKTLLTGITCYLVKMAALPDLPNGCSKNKNPGNENPI